MTASGSLGVISSSVVRDVQEKMAARNPYPDQHLVSLGQWSDEQHAAVIAECEAEVRDTAKRAEELGTLNGGPHPEVQTMFEDVLKDMPWNLREQMKQQLGV